MSRHPVTYERLIGFAAGELDAPEAALVAAHVTTCPSCTRTVARYRAARGTVVADAVAPIAPEVMARAKALFRQIGPTAARQPVRDRGPLAVVRRVLAELIVGGAGGAAVAGVRGPGTTYGVAYASEVADIDVQVESLAGSGPTDARRLVGQVSLIDANQTPDGTTIDVGLARVQDEEPTAWIAADDTGYFTMEVAPGRYDLLVRMPQVVVVAPGLEVT